MIDLSDSKVSLESKKTEFILSEEVLQNFRKAFRWTSSSIPPSFAARAFVGMFEILNRLEVDWKKLLHVSQSFSYQKKIEMGQEMKAQSFLKRWKKRGNIYWLHFENQLTSASGETLLTAESLIMVED